MTTLFSVIQHTFLLFLFVFFLKPSKCPLKQSFNLVVLILRSQISTYIKKSDRQGETGHVGGISVIGYINQSFLKDCRN